MQDNFTDENLEMLLKYIDGEMSEAERASVETLMQSNVSFKEHYENLLNAKKAIYKQGIRAKVQALHNEYMNVEKAASTAKIAKISVTKLLMRIAAVFVVVLAGYATYQYTSITNDKLFADNFKSYLLPVNRGVGQISQVDSLYNAQDFSGVISATNKTTAKDQKTYFLQALAYLQTNNTANAINAFKNVEQLNSNSSEKYFAQETDYYLMLAYLKANNITSAEMQLNKITANKKHKYYNNATSISKTNLMILKWKE